MANEGLTQAVEFVKTASREDLNRLFQIARLRYNILSTEATMNFVVGDAAEFTCTAKLRRPSRLVKGTITKITAKHIHLREDGENLTWRVDASMLNLST